MSVAEPNPGSPSRNYFSLVSALSGFSLLGFGTLSLALSLFFWSPSGILVSLAVLVHGLLEIRFRKAAISGFEPNALGKMAWNQLALAVSISLYALWHIFTTDPEILENLLQQPLIQTVFNLYPIELRLTLIDALPRIVTVFYLLVIFVIWLGCGATAIYYWKQSKRDIAA